MELTIGRLWREATAEPRSEPAYLHRVGRDWQELSWSDAARAVDELANGLLALGLLKGDRFAILARTTVEWALFDFALALAGAVSVPIYPTSSRRDVLYLLEHSGSVGALVEDGGQRESLAEASLEHVLAFADLEQLRARGRAYAAEHPGALAAREASIAADDLYTFLYTSGTTGEPKGCMIRHRNFHAMVRKSDEVTGGFVRAGDLMLLHLPLAHSYGRLMHLAAAYTGCTLACLPEPAEAAAALPRIRPTVFPSVPRVYEKAYAATLARIAAERAPRRLIGRWALRVGTRAAARERRRERISLPLALQRRLADRLVHARIRARFGGRLRLATAGGAALPREVAEFFHGIGILVLEGYGLSEVSGAASFNRLDAFRFGTVGRPLPGFELRIADDGEILIRSETVFAGYYRDESATREALDADGFLRTGDVGRIEDGFLVITDRKKDLIVTSGGKKVAPQPLENELQACPAVSQAIVVGDGKPYVAALVTVDPDATRALGADEIRATIQAAVDDVNRGRAAFERIRRFAVLEREFRAEAGEVTPTLKLRRGAIAEHYAEEIDALYLAGQRMRRAPT